MKHRLLFQENMTKHFQLFEELVYNSNTGNVCFYSYFIRNNVNRNYEEYLKIPYQRVMT